MRHVKIEPKAWPFLIGCVSDTHVPRRARFLPAELLQGLAGVDLILHAGDLVTDEVLADLGVVARVVAVAGNMDPAHLVPGLGRRTLIEVGPWRVGLVHGDQGDGATTPARALAAFTRETAGPGPAAPSTLPPGAPAPGVDAVVFGHSHQPLCEEREGVLLLNPGSPTDYRFAPWPSFGRLMLPGPERDGRPVGEIVRLPA